MTDCVTVAVLSSKGDSGRFSRRTFAHFQGGVYQAKHITDLRAGVGDDARILVAFGSSYAVDAPGAGAFLQGLKKSFGKSFVDSFETIFTASDGKDFVSGSFVLFADGDYCLLKA